MLQVAAAKTAAAAATAARETAVTTTANCQLPTANCHSHAVAMARATHGYGSARRWRHRNPRPSTTKMNRRAAAAAQLLSLLALPSPLLVVVAQGGQGQGGFEVSSDEFHIMWCFEPCAGGFTGNELIPGTKCVYYHECWAGEVRMRKGCGSPLAFNVDMDYCDFPTEFTCYDEIVCPEETEPPTMSAEPTEAPIPPTERPTKSPVPPTPRPTKITISQGPTEAPVSASAYDYLPVLPPTPWIPVDPGDALGHLRNRREYIEKSILISRDGEGSYHPSTLYTFDRFLSSLRTMAVDGFGADFRFYLFQGDPNLYLYGLVNLAAFLANAMVESIDGDKCDEWNWQDTSGRYAISNACGQEGRSYQDETCDEDRGVDDPALATSCAVDPDMEITAVSSSPFPRAPPPLECASGSGYAHRSGYWDENAGAVVESGGYSNDLGRTNTEGCCWWGRGALMTRGVCNLGKVDRLLGKGGADMRKPTLYPFVDFCESPDAICESVHSEELRWTVAMFEWSERIQRYGRDGWNYDEQLKEFFDGGMADPRFVDSVSRILARGCHELGCSEFEVRDLDKRQSNFYLILHEIIDMGRLLNPPDPTNRPTERPTASPVTERPTPRPTRRPTPRPTVAAATPDPTEASAPRPPLFGPPSLESQGDLIGLEPNGSGEAHSPLHSSLLLTVASAAYNLLLLP
ncbi:hypothetical protein ACHAWF_012182 [Thalassiosira exigua]